MRVGAPRLTPSRHAFAGALLVAALAAGVVLLSGGGGHTGGARAREEPGVVAGDPGTGTAKPGTGVAKPGALPARRVGGGAPTGGAKTVPPRSSSATRAEAVGTAAAGGGAAGGAAARPTAVAGVEEVRDPEESKSFPLPATVHHRSASSPSVAGEAAVAPGAASDAEIRKELGEEEQAKAQERAARRHILTAVAGGFSVGGNGTIPIPTDIPETVQRVIAGGNAIADFPYIWGGGHGSFIANGYDCSGSVSYALAAGGLLSQPLVSGDLAGWGEPGPGRWITIYANAGHTFMDVDGMWFDTAGRSGPYASRWLVSQPPLAGYAVRHPPGL
jgi:cell wall-associated NlpC family hydrolase